MNTTLVIWNSTGFFSIDKENCGKSSLHGPFTTDTALKFYFHPFCSQSFHKHPSTLTFVPDAMLGIWSNYVRKTRAVPWRPTQCSYLALNFADTLTPLSRV